MSFNASSTPPIASSASTSMINVCMSDVEDQENTYPDSPSSNGAASRGPSSAGMTLSLSMHQPNNAPRADASQHWRGASTLSSMTSGTSLSSSSGFSDGLPLSSSNAPPTWDLRAAASPSVQSQAVNGFSLHTMNHGNSPASHLSTWGASHNSPVLDPTHGDWGRKSEKELLEGCDEKASSTSSTSAASDMSEDATMTDDSGSGTSTIPSNSTSPRSTIQNQHLSEGEKGKRKRTNEKGSAAGSAASTEVLDPTEHYLEMIRSFSISVPGVFENEQSFRDIAKMAWEALRTDFARYIDQEPNSSNSVEALEVSRYNGIRVIARCLNTYFSRDILQEDDWARHFNDFDENFRSLSSEDPNEGQMHVDQQSKNIDKLKELKVAQQKAVSQKIVQSLFAWIKSQSDQKWIRSKILSQKDDRAILVLLTSLFDSTCVSSPSRRKGAAK
jgi:hypothetical protein